MTAVNLTPLLIRARDAGLSLRAEDGDVVATPKGRLTPELRDEIVRRKAELLEALRWDEAAAIALLKDAAAYLNGPLQIALEHLEETDRRAVYSDLPEDHLVEAFEARDMFRYRINVRLWVQKAKATLREAEECRDQEAADGWRQGKGGEPCLTLELLREKEVGWWTNRNCAATRIGSWRSSSREARKPSGCARSSIARTRRRAKPCRGSSASPTRTRRWWAKTPSRRCGRPSIRARRPRRSRCRPSLKSSKKNGATNCKGGRGGSYERVCLYKVGWREV